MISSILQFAALWTVCARGSIIGGKRNQSVPRSSSRIGKVSSNLISQLGAVLARNVYSFVSASCGNECTPVKHYNDYYYQPDNSTRVTLDGIAAYRSALTLDWMSAEDSRQRELVAAFEQDPQFPSPMAKSDCFNYHLPPAGSIAKLMLEVLKNLEGDDGYLIARLVQALVRTKLLLLESTMFENEPDLDALVKTPAAMVGEPHTTFPRVVEVLWLAVTDPSSVKKHGWCTVNKMTSFLNANHPKGIARHLRAAEQIITRARFIMEEFIQHVTPLNMEKETRTTTAISKQYQSPRPLPNPRYPPRSVNVNKNRRPVRMQPLEDSEQVFRYMPVPTESDDPYSIEADVTITDEPSQPDEENFMEETLPARQVKHVQLSTSSKNQQINQWLFTLMMFLLL